MRALPITMLVAAGCGIGSYDQFRDQLAARSCERQVRCGQLGASESQNGCGVPWPLLTVATGAVDIPTEIAARRLTFHPDNAAECLDAVKHAPCDTAQAEEDVWRHCHGVVTGAVANGGTCWGDEECVGGLCVNPDCGGTCTPFAFPGGACVAGGGTPDMTCDPSVQFCSGDGTCFRKETQGGPCASDDQCLFALVCAAGKCDDPPRVARGNACGGTLPCADGLYCSASGICLPLVVDGQPCTQKDACQPGTACVAGTCTAWLDIGAACMPDAVSPLGGCPATQTCTSGACTSNVKLSAGPLAKCTSDADCDAGLHCVAAGYCDYVGGVNAGCTSDSDCASNLQCLDGACHTPGFIMCATAM
jgi:hypothetical protein